MRIQQHSRLAVTVSLVAGFGSHLFVSLVSNHRVLDTCTLSTQSQQSAC
jgi:hypothetical protein